MMPQGEGRFNTIPSRRSEIKPPADERPQHSYGGSNVRHTHLFRSCSDRQHQVSSLVRPYRHDRRPSADDVGRELMQSSSEESDASDAITVSYYSIISIGL